MKKVIKPYVVQRCGGCETGDMPAHLGADTIGLNHHRHCVPADIRANPPFDFVIARRVFFQVCGNGVDVSGIGAKRQIRAGTPRFFNHMLQQKMRPFCAFLFQHRIQRI